MILKLCRSLHLWGKQIVNESIKQAFSAQAFTGYWKIQHKDYPKAFFGEFLYDPIKGRNELTLYGIGSISLYSSNISVITGEITTGKQVSIFDPCVKNISSGTGGLLSQRTVFSFCFFCIGDEYFTTKESIRLRKCSFRCTNLELWADYLPFKYHFSSRRKRRLCDINLPAPLMMFEDDLVRIKLSTTLNQNMSLFSLHASYYHEIIIEAKNNRKLPYFGGRGSFSYYEKVVFCFLGVMIGKNAVIFHCIGNVGKQGIEVPNDTVVTRSKKKMYSFSTVEFLYARKIEESWIDEISSNKVLMGRRAIGDDNLYRIISGFFINFDKFDFILDDWLAMRNRSSFTNHSLPELLYNLEGLHRALYPECDTTSGYKESINAIHEISPFEQYNQLIKNSKHTLPFKQRLQDILLIRVSQFFPYLTLSQKNDIINYLHGIRDNAAHREGQPDFRINKMIPCIFLCEELIAIMIFMNIGLQVQQIMTVFQHKQEWLTLKNMLRKEFGNNEDE